MIDRIATAITDHSRVAIVVLLLVTAGLVPGLGGIEESGSVGGVADDSDVADAHAEVQERFNDQGPNTTTTVIVVRSDERNVLSREMLLRTLRYQRTLQTNETINRTLVEEDPVFGIENIVARAAIEADRQGEIAEPTIADFNESQGVIEDNRSNAEWETPTVDAQIAQLESMSDSEVSDLVDDILDPSNSSEARRLSYQLLPKNYTPGDIEADDRMLVLTQKTDGRVGTAAGFSAEVSEAQATARTIATDRDEQYYFYGAGMVNYEQDIVIGDSFGILGPLAMLFVLLALSLAYRDPVDIVLGVVGIVLVLLWTFGTMGWLGIQFNPVMIAAPIILIGLSVDFALHITMRYREKRHAEESGVRSAMAAALGSLGPALVLITMTTGIGFLSNYTSPLGDIRAFGLVTTIGITSTLLVFGVLMPAIKTEISSLLDGRGWDRTPSLPGSSGSIRRVLTGGATIASRAPLVLLVVTVLLTGGAAYGATDLQLSADQELFMGDNPPEWVSEKLPAALKPGEYSLKTDRQYIFSKFQSPERQGYVLITGNLTNPETLERIADAEAAAAESSAVYVSAGGDQEIVTSVSEMQEVADDNPGFNQTLADADTSGNGVPDRNLATVYEEFHEVAPDRAERTVERTTTGAYPAMLIRIATDGSADRSDAVVPITAAANAVDGAGLHAIGTGVFVIEETINERISTTLIGSLTITVLTILLILVVTFRLKAESATLGVVTLIPVVLSATWLFGTMAILGIPISLITAMVGSITVGIGVDYAIHISERYGEERRRTADASEALIETVVGTGSALLSSAATTALGFGVLAFALLPALRQFGLVLALGVIYSFIAAVYVQPSLLAVWEQYQPSAEAVTKSPTASEGD